MKRLVRFLLTGDLHVCSYEKPFETLHVVPDGGTKPSKVIFICRCSTCGNIKKTIIKD